MPGCRLHEERFHQRRHLLRVLQHGAMARPWELCQPRAGDVLCQLQLAANRSQDVGSGNLHSTGASNQRDNCSCKCHQMYMR